MELIMYCNKLERLSLSGTSTITQYIQARLVLTLSTLYKARVAVTNTLGFYVTRLITTVKFFKYRPSESAIKSPLPDIEALFEIIEKGVKMSKFMRLLLWMSFP
jgi:hypothetical protein